MKHIFIIENMSCEHCANAIKTELASFAISCEINLERKSVSVERDGNIVTTARRAIVELGYKIL